MRVKLKKLTIAKIFFVALLSISLSGCTRLFGEPEIGVRITGEKPPTKIQTKQKTASKENINTGIDDENNEHSQILENYGGVYNNRKAQIMVANIASKLLVAAGQGNSKFTVTILDSAEVNAFALPGGYIYVTRGLLALANDSSELAAVLSHEIAHIILKHARARSERTLASQIVDRVINNVLGGNSETDQMAARSRLSLAAFSQSQELAADKEGIIIAGRAGYDPHAAARLLNSMRRFANLISKQNENLDDFLSSHPSTPNRIEKAIKNARSFGAPGMGETGREQYLTAISGLRFGISPNQGAIIGQKFIQPKLKFTFSVPQNYKLQHSQSSIVAIANDGEAMRFDSAIVPRSMALDEYLRSGWVAGLKKESIILEKRDNFELAHADAQTKDWVFKISIIRFEGAVYRFIFAGKNNSAQFIKGAKDTVRSFRRANSKDFAQIKNSYIEIIRAKSGDTIASMMQKMAPIKDAKTIFLVLNDLYNDDPLIIGRQYKIVKID